MTVAEWIVGTPSTGEAAARPACPMAHRRSPLGSRVNRILATGGQPAKPLGLIRWAGGAAVLTAALAAPGFAAKNTRTIEVDASFVPGAMEVVHTSPKAAFAALASSIDELQEEIRALIALAATRDVAPSTTRRLRALQLHAMQIRSVASQIERRQQQLTR